MAIVIPAAIWNLISIGVQSLLTRAMLLLERGATKEEIQAHIDQMEAENKKASDELDLLRQQNPTIPSS